MASTVKREAKRRRVGARRTLARACVGVCVSAIVIVIARRRDGIDVEGALDEGGGGWRLDRFVFGRGSAREVAPEVARAPATYETRDASTGFAPDGGPREYGNVHRVSCGSDAALTGFRFDVQSDGDENKSVRNAYACVEAKNDDGLAFGGVSDARETTQGPSGSRWHGRDSYDNLNEHAVDCLDAFLSGWYLKQWSKSMSIVYECTTGRSTPRRDACETLESASVVFDVEAISSLAPATVSCPQEHALTAFKFNGRAFEFTCCPRPEL